MPKDLYISLPGSGMKWAAMFGSPPNWAGMGSGRTNEPGLGRPKLKQAKTCVFKQFLAGKFPWKNSSHSGLTEGWCIK